MKNVDPSLRPAIRRILRDIEVEVGSSIDGNFRSQSFYGEAWQRRTSPGAGGRAVLTQSGALRRSIHAATGSDSVTFTSDKPYAALHNEGGEIRVTARMKGYFWYRYRLATGSVRKRRDGTPRRDRRNRELGAEAEFFRAMALKPVGSTIKMPSRRFMGMHPRLEALVRSIVEGEMEKYLAGYDPAK